MISRIKQFLSQPCIAVDLGTANTRVYSSELDRISEKPSTIPQAGKSGANPISDEYIVYLNSKLVTTPLRGGVIVDVGNAVLLLKSLMRENRTGLRNPISLASAPTDASAKERERLTKVIKNAGASHVVIIPEVWAAAIGAGMDVNRPQAQAVIDIGEGVTDLAVIKDGRIIFNSAVRTACSDLQRAVRSAIVAKYKVCIFADEAQRLTHKVSLISDEAESDSAKRIRVSGMDILKGCKVDIDVYEQDIVSALKPVITSILKMIERALKKLPATELHQVWESGIYLTGGGACITGIDRLIASRTNLDVRISNDPIHSVINGEIETLNFWKDRKNWWQNISWPILASS